MLSTSDCSTLIKTYIVYLEDHPEGSELLGEEDLEAWHKSFFPNATLASGEPKLIHSYCVAISGFAAKLTPAEVRDISGREGFVSVKTENPICLLTTYTPRFLGLDGHEMEAQDLWPDS